MEQVCVQNYLGPTLKPGRHRRPPASLLWFRNRSNGAWHVEYLEDDSGRAYCGRVVRGAGAYTARFDVLDEDIQRLPRCSRCSEYRMLLQYDLQQWLAMRPYVKLRRTPLPRDHVECVLEIMDGYGDREEINFWLMYSRIYGAPQPTRTATSRERIIRIR